MIHETGVSYLSLCFLHQPPRFTPMTNPPNFYPRNPPSPVHQPAGYVLSVADIKSAIQIAEELRPQICLPIQHIGRTR